ncbi:hypothetical protein [Desulfotruncus alcoholivorax]|uniref:hypothetical protein n=1 Tax=Desulfotruncus alcoholivorax TaxID=265477 RepID=UPI00040242EE|nr:hypothetical protein [Desulfotruncus alcoholivorax]
MDNQKKDTDTKRGERKMATQLQPTPTLYGKDAIEVLEQIKRKPTKDEKKAAEERKIFFARIKKKGLR